MTEPSSSLAALAGIFGAGFAGFLSGIDSGAAIGALCGSLVYFSTTKELPLPNRMTFFMISFVIGYMSAPALAQAQLFGVGPIEVSGIAAFFGSALVVTATLAAIRSRTVMTKGGSDG